MSNKTLKRILLILSITSVIASFTACSNQNEDSYTVTSNNLESSVSMEMTEKEETTAVETTVKQYYEVDKVICSLDALNLRQTDSTDSKVIDVIDKFNFMHAIKTNDDWYYVVYEKNDNLYEGYVSCKYTKDLTNTFIEVDLSDQKLYMYKDKDRINEIDITSGMKNKYDTRLGCNPIYSKEQNRYLSGDDYKVHVSFWMPFDGGQGLHDADEWRSSYGGNIYESNGSHGCVSMSYSDAEYIYDNVSVGDMVLIHK